MNEKNDSKYRDSLVSGKRISQSSLDKYLITLSSGALGLSIVFISNFLKDRIIICKSVLFISWIFFILVLLMVVLSFWFSSKAFEKAIVQSDGMNSPNSKVGGFWSTIVGVLNLASLVCFFFGLITLLLFISQNF